MAGGDGFLVPAEGTTIITMGDDGVPPRRKIRDIMLAVMDGNHHIEEKMYLSEI